MPFPFANCGRILALRSARWQRRRFLVSIASTNLAKYFLQSADRRKHRTCLHRHKHHLGIVAGSHVRQRLNVTLHQQVLSRISLTGGYRISHLFYSLGFCLGVSHSSLGLSLGPLDRPLFLTLCSFNIPCLLSFPSVARGLFLAVSLQNQGSSAPLRSHLFFHRYANVLRRVDVPNLNAGDLHSPSFGCLVEHDSQFVVNYISRRKSMIQIEIADNRTHCGD